MKKRAFFVVTVAIIALLLLAQIASVSAAPAKKGPPVKPTDTPAGPTDTPAPTNTPGGAKPWTVMVYIVGDNNLEDYVTKDLESELDFSDTNLNVVALADRHPGYSKARGDWTQTLLYYVTPGMTADEASALEDWGERNMGDPQTLIEFMNWTANNYPGERYVLALWDHGWMWRPYQQMWDESQDDCLDPDEIVYAIGQTFPVDVVVYDSCEGMCIENAVMWQSLGAAAIAGSEDDTGMDAIEYEDVLPQMQANPSMSSNDVAKEFSLSQNDYTSSSATLGAPMTDLVGAVDELAVALINALPSHQAEIYEAFQKAFGMEDNTNKDLHDLADALVQYVSDSTVDAKAAAVADAVDAAILESHYNDPHNWWGYADNVYGIGIWGPKNEGETDEGSSPQSDWDYYQTLAFSAQTNWNEFLDAFIFP
jgi:hypothetical protein